MGRGREEVLGNGRFGIWIGRRSKMVGAVEERFGVEREKGIGVSLKVDGTPVIVRTVVRAIV